MVVAFVQYDDLYDNSIDNTIANGSALNTTTGNLLVACFQIDTDTAGDDVITGVSDTEGNTYVKSHGVKYSSKRKEVWYAKNITGNANNITTATFTGNCDDRYISISEFSGIHLTDPVIDSSFRNIAFTNSPDSGTVTSTSFGDLLIGFIVGNASRTHTLGSGFSTLSSNATRSYFAEYRILGAVGDYVADMTLSGNDTVSLVGIIFGVEAVAGFTRKIKIAGTFQDKPIKEKKAGTFQNKPISIKVGGTFQDA